MFRAVKYLYVPLVISALSKVDELTISMENRAFGLYSARTYLNGEGLSGKDKLAILLIPLVFLAFYLIFRFLI